MENISSKFIFILFLSFFLVRLVTPLALAQGFQDPFATQEAIEKLNKYLCFLFNCQGQNNPSSDTGVPIPTVTGSSQNPTSGPSPTSDPNNPQPTNPPPSSNGFVYYCQGKSDWSGICAMGTSGCCPTSVAMVVSSLGHNYNPVQVDQVFRDRGARACGRYCTFYSNNRLTISDWIEGLGLVISENLVFPGSGFNSAEANRYLERGCYILAATNWVDGQKFECGQSCQPNKVYFGHVYAIDGVSGNQMHIRDPSNCFYGPGNESSNFQTRSTSIVDYAVAVCQRR